MWRNFCTDQQLIDVPGEANLRDCDRCTGSTPVDAVGPGPTPEESARRLRMWGEQKDLDRVTTLFATDAVLFMPVTNRLCLNGREEIRFLLGGVFTAVDVIRFHTDFGEGACRVLVYNGSMGSREYEESLLLRFNERNEIAEMFASVRPFDGMMQLSARLAPELIRKNRRFRRAKAVAATMRLFAQVWDFGDRRILWLIRPRSRSRA